MRSNHAVGDLVTFICHAEEDVSIVVDARIREVHEDGTADLEVFVSERVTINKRRVRFGDVAGCWRERPVEVDAEEVQQ